MNNKFKTLAISAIMASAILSGCGSSSDENSKQAPKEPRINMHNQDSDNFRGQLTITSSVDRINVSARYSNPIGTTLVNNLFYIDIDNNTETGYAGMDGADYLVSNGSLYRSTGSTWGWSWEDYIGSNIDVANNTISMSLDKSLIHRIEIANRIGVVACVSDENWRVTEIAQQYSEIDNTGNVSEESVREQLLRQFNTFDHADVVIAPEGIFAIAVLSGDSTMVGVYNISDLNHITLVDTIENINRFGGDFLMPKIRNLTLVGNGQVRYDKYQEVDLIMPIIETRTIITYSYLAHREISSIFHSEGSIKLDVSNGNNNHTFNIEYNENTADAVNTTIIYIDADGNTATGFNGNYASGMAGADFMIANGYLSRSTGRAWGWEGIGNVDYSTVDRFHIRATVSNDMVPMSANANVSVIAKDTDWNTVDRSHIK